MNWKKEASKLEPELIRLRRYYHRHPELSWKENNTQSTIEAYLKELGIPFAEAAGTGVIATVHGRNSEKFGKRILGIRADMDALPLQEKTDCEFCSKNPGVMHACGHDAHNAMLLGTAAALAQHIDQLACTVRLIFQPAEECIENSGAYYMKDEQLVAECDELIGLHIWGMMEAGYASLRQGPVMASADTFDITIEGKGGHGAHPDKAIDPITAGTAFVESLNRAMARERNPLLPSVLSVTSFQAGNTSNVLPQTARLKGTARAFDPEIRNSFPELLNRISGGIEQETKAQIHVDYHWGPPALFNDRMQADTGCMAGESVFGRDHMIEAPLEMAGEDFAKYRNPKCFLLLGCGDPDPAKRFEQHSPRFVVDERVLKLGVAWFLNYTELFSRRHTGEEIRLHPAQEAEK